MGAAAAECVCTAACRQCVCWISKPADGYDGPANGRSADDGRTADDGRSAADDGRSAADDDGRSAEYDGTTNAAITGATAANVQHAANAAAATDAAQRLWSTAQCFPLIMVPFLAA